MDIEKQMFYTCKFWMPRKIHYFQAKTGSRPQGASCGRGPKGSAQCPRDSESQKQMKAMIKVISSMCFQRLIILIESDTSQDSKHLLQALQQKLKSISPNGWFCFIISDSKPKVDSTYSCLWTLTFESNTDSSLSGFLPAPTQASHSFPEHM